MELDEFQTIVTIISLLIAIVSLIITLANVWSHKETVVVQAKPVVVDPANLELENKIDAMNERLFNK